MLRPKLLLIVAAIFLVQLAQASGAERKVPQSGAKEVQVPFQCHPGELGGNQVTIERVAEMGRKYAARIDANPGKVGVEDGTANVGRCRGSPADCAHRRDKHVIWQNLVVGKLVELQWSDEATEALEKLVGQHVLYASNRNAAFNKLRLLQRASKWANLERPGFI